MVILEILWTGHNIQSRYRCLARRVEWVGVKVVNWCFRNAEFEEPLIFIDRYCVAFVMQKRAFSWHILYCLRIVCDRHRRGVKAEQMEHPSWNGITFGISCNTTQLVKWYDRPHASERSFVVTAIRFFLFEITLFFFSFYFNGCLRTARISCLLVYRNDIHSCAQWIRLSTSSFAQWNEDETIQTRVWPSYSSRYLIIL